MLAEGAPACFLGSPLAPVTHRLFLRVSRMAGGMYAQGIIGDRSGVILA